MEQIQLQVQIERLESSLIIKIIIIQFYYSKRDKKKMDSSSCKEKNVVLFSLSGSWCCMSKTMSVIRWLRVSFESAMVSSLFAAASPISSWHIYTATGKISSVLRWVALVHTSHTGLSGPPRFLCSQTHTSVVFVNRCCLLGRGVVTFIFIFAF